MTNSSETPVIKPERINAVDALRGFALAGIVLTHVVEQYMAYMPTPEMDAVMTQGPVDMAVNGFIFWVLRGKFFALFSFLFGISFFLQMDAAAKKGLDFKLRFLWRLIILFGIGLVHRFFYAGDILTLYAILGIVLIPFYHLNNKIVFAIAGLLFLGAGRYIAFAIWGSGPVFVVPGLEKMYENYLTVLTSGSFTDIIRCNWIRLLDDYNFQIKPFTGRGYLTFAFFLLGMLIGGKRWLENIVEHLPLIKKIMYYSLVGTVVMIPVFAFLYSRMENIFVYETWLSMFAITAYDNFNLFFTLFLAAGFIVLFEKKKDQSFLSYFAPFGRMALTNYFLQSVIGAFIFFGWGLGLLGKMRNIEAFVLAIVILIIQMIISTYWLRRFNYGPLEWFWRSLTYFKWQPFVRKANI